MTAMFVAAFTAGISAQAGQDKPAQQPSAAPGKVTISGCIQNAPAAPGAADAAAADAAKFVLANAKISGGAAGGGAVGTTGTAAPRYQLQGEEKTISPHVNHQVEITGTVQSAPAGGAAGAAAGPTLRVDSVKMVADKCAQ